MSVLPGPVRNFARHPHRIRVYLRVKREIDAAAPGRMLKPRDEFAPKFTVEHINILAHAYTYWDDTKPREGTCRAIRRSAHTDRPRR
jgi:hypothetical protein